MKTRVDERLRAEAARFALRFACESCAHFVDAPLGAGHCAHEYPAAPRAGALDGDALSFCKEFELGASGDAGGAGQD